MSRTFVIASDGELDITEIKSLSVPTSWFTGKQFYKYEAIAMKFSIHKLRRRGVTGAAPGQYNNGVSNSVFVDV